MQDDAIDEIGPWSEVKLDIIKEYGTAYSKILSAEKQSWARHIYIDAFSGSGICLSRTTREFVKGSPVNALLIDPPFKEFHLIDIESAKIDVLRREVEIASEANGIPNNAVSVHRGDCNEILRDQLFPMIRANNKIRALCILDPYGLHLCWDVIKAAGDTKHVDIFLNFPMMDINRNALRNDTKKIDPTDIDRMNSFWGDDSWRQVAYNRTTDLFGQESDEKASTNWQFALAFKKRLQTIGGFEQVPNPMPMRNTHGAVLYYLFFASQKSVALGIVKDIFKKYRNIGLK